MRHHGRPNRPGRQRPEGPRARSLGPRGGSARGNLGPNLSGWTGQATAFIGRRQFITLLGAWLHGRWWRARRTFCAVTSVCVRSKCAWFRLGQTSLRPGAACVASWPPRYSRSAHSPALMPRAARPSGAPPHRPVDGRYGGHRFSSAMHGRRIIIQTLHPAPRNYSHNPSPRIVAPGLEGRGGQLSRSHRRRGAGG